MELYPLVEKPPRQDFVVRTRARREANGLPLMTAELVIAGEETRRTHPAGRDLPAALSQDVLPRKAARRSAGRVRAAPAGVAALRARRRRSDTRPTCFAAAWCRASPTRASRRSAASRPRTTSPRRRSCRWRRRRDCGGSPRRRWRSCCCFTRAGLAHGDAELHNIIVCPAPLEPILIDFEAAVQKETMETPLGSRAASRICSRCCARRSICSARSAGRRAARRALVESARRAVSIAGSISARHRDAGRGLTRVNESSANCTRALRRRLGKAGETRAKHVRIHDINRPFSRREK